MRSIRWRITAGFALFLGVLLALANWSIASLSQRAAEGRAQRLLTGSAKRLAYEIEQEHVLDLHDFLAEEQSFVGEPLSVEVRDANDRLVGRAGPEHQEDSRRLTGHAGSRTFVLEVPWRKPQEALRRQSQALALLSFVTGLGATLGAWFLVGRTLRPLHKLSQKAISPVPGVLVSPSQDREMLELVATLNALLASRGRFYAAASHELRTPLQSVLGHLELALSRPRTAPEYERTLHELHQQTRRLIDLVRALLSLNNLETATLPCESVDVAEVVRRQLQVRDTQHRVELEESSPLIVSAPLAHLEMLVGNLLDNALKYSPEGAPVRVCAHPLQIVNPTTAPVEWDEARLGEPFYRPDQSRTSATGGNGLGLAICRSIAETHHWKLQLKASGCQVTATVRFPEEA